MYRYGFCRKKSEGGRLDREKGWGLIASFAMLLFFCAQNTQLLLLIWASTCLYIQFFCVTRDTDLHVQAHTPEKKKKDLPFNSDLFAFGGARKSNAVAEYRKFLDFNCRYSNTFGLFFQFLHVDGSWQLFGVSLLLRRRLNFPIVTRCIKSHFFFSQSIFRYYFEKKSNSPNHIPA